MTTHYLNPGERRMVWWPFWDLPAADTVPAMQVGDSGAWKTMTPDPSFVPVVPPERANPKWFRAFLAHPDADPHADATVVPLGTSPIRHRITGNPEIEIPTRDEYVVARAH